MVSGVEALSQPALSQEAGVQPSVLPSPRETIDVPRLDGQPLTNGAVSNGNGAQELRVSDIMHTKGKLTEEAVILREAGCTNAQVAQRLGVGERAVERAFQRARAEGLLPNLPATKARDKKVDKPKNGTHSEQPTGQAASAGREPGRAYFESIRIIDRHLVQGVDRENHTPPLLPMLPAGGEKPPGPTHSDAPSHSAEVFQRDGSGIQAGEPGLTEQGTDNLVDFSTEPDAELAGTNGSSLLYGEEAPEAPNSNGQAHEAVIFQHADPDIDRAELVLFTQGIDRSTELPRDEHNLQSAKRNVSPELLVTQLREAQLIISEWKRMYDPNDKVPTVYENLAQIWNTQYPNGLQLTSETVQIILEAPSSRPSLQDLEPSQEK